MFNPMFPLPRNALVLFNEYGPSAFEETRVDIDEDGRPTDVQVVKVIKVAPAVRAFNKKFLWGVGITRRILMPDGKHIEVTDLIPSHYTVRDRSKYKPHQGAQECLRRRVGGWANHKRTGEFYGFYGETKRAALTERNDPAITGEVNV